MFCEKELQNSNQKQFRIEKVIKKKVISYMSNGKDIMIHLIVGLIKKMLLYDCLIMPQNLTSKRQQVLIHCNLLKKMI